MQFGTKWRLSYSVLGKVNEIAKHKASVEDADTQSKVHQLYETIQRWSPVASTLPELVQRLVTIKQLHEQGGRGVQRNWKVGNFYSLSSCLAF